MTSLEDRLPPQNRMAEQSVLGSCLVDNAIVGDVFESLTPSSFYFAAHQQIARSIQSLQAQGSPIDLVILADHLKQSGSIDDVGGYAYLGELWDAAPTSLNAIYYANIVRECYLAREMIHFCNEYLRDAYQPHCPVDDLVSSLQRDALAMGQGIKTSLNHPLPDVIIEAMSEIDRRQNLADNAVIGIPSGLVDLDHMTGGFHKQELCILAARPSVGKTAMAAQICQHAGEIGIVSMIVSLEQSRVELGTRMLCGRSGISNQVIRRGRLQPEQVQALIQASGPLRELPIIINDTPAQYLRNIWSAVRRAKVQRPELSLVAVDYLQLIRAEDTRVNRTEQVSQMTQSLKHLAREMDIALIVLSQMSRNSEQREDKRPRLSDLRDSGSIEQDADTVIFLHRPGAKDTSQPTEIIEAVIEKQRNGAVGTVPLSFRKAGTRFENHSQIPM